MDVILGMNWLSFNPIIRLLLEGNSQRMKLVLIHQFLKEIQEEIEYFILLTHREEEIEYFILLTHREVSTTKEMKTCMSYKNTWMFSLKEISGLSLKKKD